jgi:hypothetical protein
MNRLVNILGIVLLGLIGLILFVFFLPIIAIAYPFVFLDNWKRERRLKKYISGLGDKNFFCYNNRADAKTFIENELIPRLDNGIELIYLDGHEPRSKYVQDHISLALYKLQNYSRFPHLLKLRNGDIIDESINNEFFNTMTQNKPLDKLLMDINSFFDLTLDTKSHHKINS